MITRPARQADTRRGIARPSIYAHVVLYVAAPTGSTQTGGGGGGLATRASAAASTSVARRGVDRPTAELIGEGPSRRRRRRSAGPRRAGPPLDGEGRTWTPRTGKSTCTRAWTCCGRAVSPSVQSRRRRVPPRYAKTYVTNRRASR